MSKKSTTSTKTVKSANNNNTKKKQTKLFVLDTNVLLHDPECLYNFQDNDIALPLIVLEELDNHKRGTSDLARNARQANRVLDRMLSNQPDIAKGIPLCDSAFTIKKNGDDCSFGKLYFCTDPIIDEDWEGLSDTSNDNKILAVLRQLIRAYPGRLVVLVSKDINIRVKAMALGLKSEDYTTDQALEDSQLLYNGFEDITDDDWQGLSVKSWVDKARNHYQIQGKFADKLLINQAVFLHHSKNQNPANDDSIAMQVTSKNENGIEMQEMISHTSSRNGIWGITARNREQNVALNYLLDPNIDLVTILGAAGTGKTLLTLAAGLHQVFDQKRFEEIIITRATVPIGDDIGFLPGTEEEKMNPWMGALDDNLKVLSGQVNVSKDDGEKNDKNVYNKQIEQWEKDSKVDMLRTRIKVKSLSFMRGRTFVSRYLIIDEAQNLTPPQLKSLITRAGPGTKVICMGNLGQIDTPYLTPLTSGLTWLVERFKNWQHCGHIILQRGERSRLATYAEQALE